MFRIRICRELLTGQVPYVGRSFAQITGLVGYYGQQLTVNAKKSNLLGRVAKNCLLFEPQRRPTFVDVLHCLEKHESKVCSKSNGKSTAANVGSCR